MSRYIDVFKFQSHLTLPSVPDHDVSLKENVRVTECERKNKQL
jgi:hypothetical protein